MATAPANGQFGRDEFLVFSGNGVSDRAKYLKDASGRNYILNPNTGEPYIVPKDYNPSATANYFREPDDSAQQLQGLDLLRALMQSQQPWGGPF